MSHYRIRSGYDLGALFLTLKTFSAMPTHMTNICAKFK